MDSAQLYLLPTFVIEWSMESKNGKKKNLSIFNDINLKKTKKKIFSERKNILNICDHNENLVVGEKNVVVLFCYIYDVSVFFLLVLPLVIQALFREEMAHFKFKLNSLNSKRKYCHFRSQNKNFVFILTIFSREISAPQCSSQGHAAERLFSCSEEKYLKFPLRCHYNCWV